MGPSFEELDDIEKTSLLLNMQSEMLEAKNSTIRQLNMQGDAIVALKAHNDLMTSQMANMSSLLQQLVNASTSSPSSSLPQASPLVNPTPMEVNPPPRVSLAPMESNVSIPHRPLSLSVKWEFPDAVLKEDFSNSSLWTTRLFSTAEQYGILACFEGSNSGSAPKDLGEDKMSAARTLLTKSVCDKVATRMVTSWRPSPLNHIHPYLLYARLKEQWAQQLTDTKKEDLEHQLDTLILYLKEPISSLFGRVSDLWVELDAVGAGVTERKLVNAIYKAVSRHPEYALQCETLRSLSFEGARSLLTSRETDLMRQAKAGPVTQVWPGLASSSGSSGLKTPSKQSLQSLFGMREGEAGDEEGDVLDFLREAVAVMKVGQGSKGATTFRGDSSKLRCFNCGKMGHSNRDCKGKDIGNRFTFAPSSLKKKKEEEEKKKE